VKAYGPVTKLIIEAFRGGQSVDQCVRKLVDRQDKIDGRYNELRAAAQ